MQICIYDINEKSYIAFIHDIYIVIYMYRQLSHTLLFLIKLLILICKIIIHINI